jgi:glycogen operon protein
MTQGDWSRGDAFALGAYLNGAEIPTLTPDGQQIVDESFIVLFNAWREPVTFTLPPVRFGRRWTHELCTAEPDVPPNGTTFAARAGGPHEVRALRVLLRAG